MSIRLLPPTARALERLEEFQNNKSKLGEGWTTFLKLVDRNITKLAGLKILKHKGDCISSLFPPTSPSLNTHWVGSFTMGPTFVAVFLPNYPEVIYLSFSFYLFIFSFYFLLFSFCVRAKLLQLCLTFCDPVDCSLSGSSVHGDSPGRNSGVGSHALLQGIFPTQGWNPCLWSPALRDGFLRHYLVLKYLFTWLQHSRSLVAACELSVMWDLVRWPGIEPDPPALGEWSLSHWTTRKVQLFLISILFLHLCQKSRADPLPLVRLPVFLSSYLFSDIPMSAP